MVIPSDLISAKESRSDYPSKEGVVTFTREIAILLFPIIAGGGYCPVPAGTLWDKLVGLLEPMEKRLKDKPEVIAGKFFTRLKDIKEQLNGDASFISANDPAATEIDEVIMTYPGFFAILIYRLSHCLSALNVPIVPRVMTEHAHSVTGIDIHPAASIGSPFFIDHGTGIVIGETSVIGDRVKFYQGVTIGALSVKKSMAATKRHPTIEDDVIIYAGGTILGGKTVIGHDSVIGGNVWLTESVPPFSVVYHLNKTTVKDRGVKNGKQ